MKKLLFSAIIIGSLVSCGDSSTGKIIKKEGKVVSSAASGSVTDAELEKQLKELEKEENRRLAEVKATSTSLKFDKEKHDFGNVGPDSDNKTDFTVTNTGDKPLIIEDVSASCGCTMPKKPEGPILPGESDVIEVVFHPKPGQKNEIIKTVTVTANTVEKIHIVEIRAFVTE